MVQGHLDLIRPVDESSMLMRRYMHQYNYSREDLASVSISLRQYANHNNKALMQHKSLTLDDYMSARMISDPLCLFDNCLESDGAIAIVIAKSRHCKKPKQNTGNYSFILTRNE